jgi:hypothetical protein
LRPDGALLCVALASGLFGYTFSTHRSMHAPPLRSAQPLRRALTASAVFCVVALLPITACP